MSVEPGRDPVSPHNRGEVSSTDLSVGGGIRKTAGLYMVVLATQALVPLLATPLLTRALGPDDFGAVVLFVVAVQLLSALANLGAPTALPRVFFRSEDGPGETRSLLLPLYGLSAAFCATAIASAMLVWSAGTGASYLVVPAVATGVWLLAVFEINVTAVRCAGRSGWFAALVAVQVLGGYGLGLSALAVGLGALGFVAGWLVGTLLAAGLSLRAGRPILSRPAPGTRHRLRAVVRLGAPAAIYALAAAGLVYVDRFVLSAYHGPGAVGEYQVAYTVGASLVSVVGAINLAWGPEVLSHLRAGWEFLQDTTEGLLGVVIALAGAVLWLAPEIVAVLAPASFDRRGIAVAACMLVTLGGLQLAQYSRIHALTWVGDLRILAPAAGAVVGLQLVLNLVLDRRFPLLGPAVSAVLAMLLLLSLLFLVTRRKAPLARLSRAVALSVIALGGLTLASAVLVWNGAPISARVWVFVVGVAVGGALVRRSRRGGTKLVQG